MQTSGNTILITGGTSGIGWAFAEKFLSLGNKVIICGRRGDRLTELQERYAGLIAKNSDVSIAAQREELAAWVIENHPDVNVLINNAGVQLLTDMTKPVDLTRVQNEIETNLVAPLHLASLFAQHFIAKKMATIINISSGLAFVPLSFMPVYCATKAAIHSITLSLRHQLKDTTVQVFEIAPPAVDTELGSDRRHDKNQTHGGMAVADFLSEAMIALENDELETAVGMAKNLREKREAMFPIMNQ